MTLIISGKIYSLSFAKGFAEFWENPNFHIFYKLKRQTKSSSFLNFLNKIQTKS